MPDVTSAMIILNTIVTAILVSRLKIQYAEISAGMGEYSLLSVMMVTMMMVMDVRRIVWWKWIIAVRAKE
jgi:uncharacterized membrane protein